MSIKVIKEVLYRHHHRGTSSRGLLCEDSPSRSPLLHCLRVLTKDHELLQWPPQLPTLKTLRLMTRGFSFSLCLGSRLTPCSVFSLPSQFLPTLYLTLFSLSHQLITAVSLLCPRVMLSRHRGRFLNRLFAFIWSFFFCFLCQVLFQVWNPSLQERITTGQPLCHFLLLPCASLSRPNSVPLGMYEAYRHYPNFHRWYGSESP